MLEYAERWLNLGCGLLPVQPGTKHLVKGFGPYQNIVTTLEDARAWWGGGRYNLAVCLPPGYICLDFDDIQVFHDWQNSIPVELLETYQEISPRGYHVFYRADPHGRPRAGVEFKRVVVCAPSKLSKFTYTRVGNYPIIALPEQAIFSLKSEEKTTKPPAAGTNKKTSFAGNDTVSKIRAAYPVYDYALSLTKLVKTGNSWSGLCPFHPDKNPSFWVSGDRWGCRSCDISGDVINLHAKVRKISNLEAIKELAKALVGVG